MSKTGPNGSAREPEERDPKDAQLDGFRVDRNSGYLTTQQGVRVDHDDDSLTAGTRGGPTLLEDFHAREKITHFDHERIPERVVHARGGAGAYGFFEPYDESLAEFTAARFLTTPGGLRTPVFVRFSTVAGSRGSADTVRDVRGGSRRSSTPRRVTMIWSATTFRSSSSRTASSSRTSCTR